MRIWIVVLMLVLGACVGRPSLEDPSLGGPKLDLETFFAGDVIGYGQFQDRFGTPLRRFEVAIQGSFDGQVLTLVEDFIYEDASTEQRIWRLRKTGEDSWEGSAPGVLGTATGEERGDAFNWRYAIDLPVPDGTLRVAFDDWMWRLDEDRVLNRAYMTKFGVDIGEVIIFFVRQVGQADN
ncbi:MAG: DUF3833 domain-containing protein [Pseudomonadota bacterium]